MPSGGHQQQIGPKLLPRAEGDHDHRPPPHGRFFCPATRIFHSPFSSYSLHMNTTDNSTLFPAYLFSRFSTAFLHKPAFVDASNSATLSFAALRSASTAAAHMLAQQGLGPGRVTLLISPNSLLFPIISLAVLSLGAILSTANPLLTPNELLSQADLSSPTLIILTRDLLLAFDAFRHRNIPVLVIEDCFNNLFAEISAGAPYHHHDLPVKINLATLDNDSSCREYISGDPALLMYSSGTTGKSKGVVTTHRNLVTMSAAMTSVWGEAMECEVLGCVVPMFHMYGFSMFVLGAVAVGSTTVIIPGRFSAEVVMEAVERYRVTRLPVVPPMVVALAKKQEEQGVKRMMGLREATSSGAPLPREHMLRFARCFPRVWLSQCYGMTETSGPITLGYLYGGGASANNNEQEDMKKMMSLGRLIPGAEGKIIDVESGEALSPNKTGELWVRAPFVMQGYLNNQQATSVALHPDGWLRTGDLCYFDPHGFLYIVDRIKELIKYKGYQVAPAELEEVLASHPDIQDVAVTSYPDTEAGEVPMACVVRRNGSNVTQDDVFSFLECKVAPYKKIRKVVFVDSLPRSSSGKILRRKLKFAATCPNDHEQAFSKL